MIELQKAKDHNERLNEEIQVLRARVRSLDTERKDLLEMVNEICCIAMVGSTPILSLQNNVFLTKNVYSLLVSNSTFGVAYLA